MFWLQENLILRKEIVCLWLFISDLSLQSLSKGKYQVWLILEHIYQKYKKMQMKYADYFHFFKTNDQIIF